jgi:hypothetical protein
MMYFHVMPKRKMPSRVRYDLANPTISVRMSKEDYDKLDNLRQTESASWKDLMLRALEEKDNTVHLGKCSKCGHGYIWSLDKEPHKAFLDQVVSKARPLCKKCREAPTT